MKAKALAIIPALLVTGCASIAPDGLSTYWQHTSHPFAGPPFGPTSEEDSLDTINADLFWERRNWFLELGAGYKLADGGFYGPELTGNVRTGYRFRWGNAFNHDAPTLTVEEPTHNALGGYIDACGELPGLVGDDC